MILIKLVLAVLLLLAMVIKKIGPHIAMFAASVFLMIICGQGPASFVSLFRDYFTNESVYNMALTIVAISMLSSLMNKTGIMNRMMDSLSETITDPRFTLMFAPFIIGLLTVAGGAYMSCPLVDAVGRDLDIKPSRLAAINLVYRHGIHFAYPLAPTFYMTVALIGCSNGELMAVTFPLSVFMLVFGWLLFVRPIKAEKRAPGEHRLRSTGRFILLVSPIIVTLILAVGVGLRMPLAVLAGTLIAIAIAYSDASTRPKEPLMKLLFGGFNPKTVLVVLAALFFKEVIGHIPEIGAALAGLADSGMPPELVCVLVCVLTALPTGSNSTAVAIATPIAVSFAQTPGQVIMYAALCMACGFMGYYFSPVHMCQLLTLEYFKTDFSELLREYRIFMPGLLSFIAVWYLVLKLVVFA